MSKKGNYRIPYNPETGNIYDYAVYKEDQQVPPAYQSIYAWMDNHEFEDSMIFLDYYRGRSACGIILKSQTTGSKYSMFMKDFIYVVENCNINKGAVSGKWTFCKRGSNYGIKLVKCLC